MHPPTLTPLDRLPAPAPGAAPPAPAPTTVTVRPDAPSPSAPAARAPSPTASPTADVIVLDDVEEGAPKLGLRERKKQATRRELERVAFELFTERGFDGVTVDDIAAAANVSKRTFYRYFESKEDVLLSDQRRQLDALRTALDARPVDEPLLTSVRQAFLHMADQYHHGRAALVERTRLIMGTPSLASRSAQHHVLWERSLAEMIARRMGIDTPNDLRPRLAAATMLAALRVTLEQWLTGDEPLDGVVDRSLRTLADLFATPGRPDPA